MIHLALTHDWELRGDGSGDIEQIQFGPMRMLLEIYRKHGAATTFLPDLMQQLRFRALAANHPELKITAESWDDHVREAFQQRHDIQLHLHPQWLNAQFEYGCWRLDDDWSILNYDRETAVAMLADGKQYLESLLRPIDSSYRCLAFRAGALAAAPSDHLFKSLAGLGLQLDVSIAGGLIVNNQNLQLDYRNCEETFLPFYPVMEDARKVSEQREDIVCVPLNHFYGSRWAVTRQNLSLARQQMRRRPQTSGAGSSQPTPASKSEPQSRARQAFEKLVMPALKGEYFVSDTGRLNYSLLREMLASIRHRAKASGLADVPVVLTNHPKDIRDLPAIERFVGEVSQAEDVRFITLTELVGKLKSGEFQVRTATSKPQRKWD
ncbi:MAG: hypothetical protein DMF70_13090 [Acidobacteria bacterium]|nr:MAG: hypothetical protein DMF70_13090 [Acidobacteriota bacterium]